MSKLECSSQAFWKTFLDLDLRYRLVGGVLLVLALAFIPNSVSAVDYSQQGITTDDYKAARFNSYASLHSGCNTVVSDSGITAIGARGSLFGADNNSSGCGYYIGHGSDNDGQLTWGDSAASGSVNFDYSGNITSVSIPSDIQSYSLNNDDYISKNFRSSIYQLSSTGWDAAAVNNDNHFTINAVGQDNQKYGDYIFLQFWKVPDGVIGSSLTPSVSVSAEDISLTGGALDQFYSDIYASTSFSFGYPSDTIPTSLKNYLALYKEKHHIEDWEGYAFLVSYIPQYASSYTLTRIAYRVDTQLVQDTIDQSLGGFSQWYVGIGNNSESATFPKLNYLYLTRTYTKNNAWSGEYAIQDLNSIRFTCISATCHDQAVITAKNSIEAHNKGVANWDWGGNNGSSWFDVFKINLIFPFSSFFSSLTDDRCVDIPTIASWLHTSQSHLCTYWDANIRSTLTPVFMSISSLLLFGFIVSWLKGNSNNAFRDNDTTRIGDRF